jgi:hypothetical protein
MKTKLVVASLSITLASLGQAAVYTSIPLTGFYNQDVIFDAGTPLGGDTAPAEFSGYNFFQNGIVNSTGGTRTDGLPANGIISHTFSGDTFNYSYTAAGSNIRAIANTTPVTATLATGAFFSSISILAGSAGVGGGGTTSYTLNYADGTVAGNLAIRDWTNGTDPASVAFNVSLNGEGTAAHTGWNGTILPSYPGTISFDTFVIPTDPARNLQSITFTNTNGGTRGIMGIAGVAAVPEPASTLLFAAACGVVGTIRRRR